MALGVADPLAMRVMPRAAGVEEEVKRLLARELHDRVAQTLTGMMVDVENFKAEQVEWSDVVRELDFIQGATRQVLASIRELLHDLRGEQLLEEPFVEALRSLAARTCDRAGIIARIDVDPAWPDHISGPAVLNLYRMVEEALANVRLHSGARNVRISLGAPSAGKLQLTVADDGKGVDTDPARPVGFGTLGMRERALILGGSVAIESELGRGTTVRMVFPVESLNLTGSPDLLAAGRRSA